MVHSKLSCVGFPGMCPGFIRLFASAALVVVLLGQIPLAAQTEESAVQTAQSADAPPLDSPTTTGPDSEPISAAQRRMAQRYKLLEDKLFTLYEFERDQNPIRSNILKRAYQQSQEKMTATHLRTIVDLLDNEQLKEAEQHQKVVLKELEELLVLLESEDRGKRVRDEIRRHQEYLKEVERILRMQKGLRAQAENNADSKRLGKSQERTAERTGKLADDIRINEEAPEQDAGKTPTDPSLDDGLPPEDENSPPEDSESPPDQNSSGESPDTDSQNQPSQGQPAEGQSGQNPETDPQNEQDSQSQNPVRQKIQAAEQRMRDAQEKLDRANRENAIADMQAAEEELAAARKELEEILRQLRKEEVERTLAMLEGRFRKMLERELRVYDNTRSLDQVTSSERNTDFEIRSGKISVEQKSIAMECERALLVLREDGSSVAFPETVDQLYQDMLQVADRLSAANTGRITIELEEDVLETLEYLIQALVTTQKDLESMKPGSPGAPGGGQPGDKPLVDSLAEIKMLRGLQERIYARHQRYSKLLNDPDDDLGSTDDPDLQTALERLSVRQQQLTDIARDIVVGKNQ